MKQMVEKQVTFCDGCKEEVYAYPCLVCGTEYCHECKKTHMTEFHHAVFFSGSEDGQYCNTCLSKPIPKEHQAKLAVYRKITALRAEHTAWSKDFRDRTKTAEAALKG